MIPKIIHYCWFGKGEMPEMAFNCIESWKKYLPNYKIKLWNEESFDVTKNRYVKEAYDCRKFAFVTDYVRLYALYYEGGVYMDTDVEVVRNIDAFLDLPAFSGFEDEFNIPTGIMASEQFGVWAKEQLDYYEDKSFVLSNGKCDLTTNVQIISSRMASEGFVLKNGYYNHLNKIHIYPKDFFCPKSYKTGKIKLTDNTHTIHHFSGSWKTKEQVLKDSVEKVIGNKTMVLLSKLKRIIS